MRILVTGANGQLGHDVVNEAIARGYDVIASDITFEYQGFDDNSAVTRAAYTRMDITNEEEVQDRIVQLYPDVIIHCAAYTNVDKAENADVITAWKCNVEGTKNIASIAQSIKAKMIYISTDYVFDDITDEPIGPYSTPCPINWYGETKLMGEKLVEILVDKRFIIRTSWVFGLSGKNFVKTMLNISKNKINVVDDQIGRPTYTVDLAKLICDMMITDRYGFYHATNTGDYISWSDFAEEIFRLTMKDIKVNRISSKQYQKQIKTKIARRPNNSRLDTEILSWFGFKPLPDWHNALCRYLQELRRNRLL